MLRRLLRSKPRRRDWYRNVYLRSDHWHALRLWALALAGYRCLRCKKGGRLDVHHRHYQTLWRETPDDVEVLCRTCHEVAEGRA
jgi:hypothetical protein